MNTTPSEHVQFANDAAAVRSRDEARIDLLGRAKMFRDRSTFIQSVLLQHESGRRVLTDRQWAALENATVGFEKQQQEAKSAPAVVYPKFPGLIAMFDRAREHVTYPAIKIQTENGRLRLYRTGPASRFPGSISITNGRPYGDSEHVWYAQILRDGTFSPKRAVEPWLLDFLTAFEADPAGMAFLHGKQTGNCCFCGHELTDPESIRVGYGPICANHYGLPHGRN